MVFYFYRQEALRDALFQDREINDSLNHVPSSAPRIPSPVEEGQSSPTVGSQVQDELKKIFLKNHFHEGRGFLRELLKDNSWDTVHAHLLHAMDDLSADRQKRWVLELARELMREYQFVSVMDLAQGIGMQRETLFEHFREFFYETAEKVTEKEKLYFSRVYAHLQPEEALDWALNDHSSNELVYQVFYVLGASYPDYGEKVLDSFIITDESHQFGKARNESSITIPSSRDRILHQYLNGFLSTALTRSYSNQAVTDRIRKYASQIHSEKYRYDLENHLREFVHRVY
ncbi:MAG: hypothetical protein AAGA18_12140 [Verrucomicrobiota bacterium]